MIASVSILISGICLLLQNRCLPILDGTGIESLFNAS